MAHPTENWLVRLAIAGGLLVLTSTLAVVRGMNSLSGHWEIHEATQNGKSLQGTERWRIFLNVRGDYACVARYWVCGEKEQTFAEGIMVRKGDRVSLHKRIRMTPQLEKQANGKFQVLPNREIAFEIPDPEGPIRLVFTRTENNSLFSWLDWS